MNITRKELKQWDGTPMGAVAVELLKHRMPYTIEHTGGGIYLVTIRFTDGSEIWVDEWGGACWYPTPEIDPSNFVSIHPGAPDDLEENSEYIAPYAREIVFFINFLIQQKKLILAKSADEIQKPCPEHGGAWDCTSFCPVCHGEQVVGGVA